MEQEITHPAAASVWGKEEFGPFLELGARRGVDEAKKLHSCRMAGYLFSFLKFAGYSYRSGNSYDPAFQASRYDTFVRPIHA